MTARPRVLVTGAGGPSAVTLIRALAPDHHVVAADIDPVAVGLYLVPAEQRVLLPRGDAHDFVDALLAAVRRHRVDLVVPTVDTELPRVAEQVDALAEHGVRALVESASTLARCQDKAVLVAECAGVVRVPTTVVLTPETTDADLDVLGQPFVVKPRRGAGGRGFSVVRSSDDLSVVPRDGSVIAQELLPGEEFSVDVLARPDGHVVAAVPRRRDKVDSGIAVAARTVRDPELEHLGRAVAQHIGATGVVNVQVRRASDGGAALLEVNARFPGTMELTRAAGVDMPRLAVAAALGADLPDHLDYAEVALVRHWADVVVPVQEYAALAAADGTTAAPGGPS